MDEKVLVVRFQMRNGTEAEWLAVASTEVPLMGEPCVTTTGDNAGGFKLGDGVTTWENLPYISGKEIEDLKTQIEDLETTVEGKLDSVTNADASIVVDATDATNPTVKVAISADSGNSLTLAADGLKVEVPDGAEYTLKKQETPNSDSVASYQLMKNDTAVGDTINIPLDYLVKSATVKTATVAEDPYAGAAVGDKYIEFVINVAAGTGTESYLYLPVNDMVQAYTGGNGIDINDTTNEVTAKVVEANGLSVDADGIKLAVADATTGGAITPEQFEQLEDLKNDGYVKDITVGTDVLVIDADGKATIPVATADKFGAVKSSDEDNGVAVAADGTMSVNSITTAMLKNADGDILVLNGGGVFITSDF